MASPLDLKQVQESVRAASLARIRAAQTPECLALGDRIVSAANDARAAVAVDMGAVVAQYEKQCAGRAKAAIQSENSRQKADQKSQEKLIQKEAACTEKRYSLDERRAKFDSLSAQERLAWARLLEEVGRECR
jgi:membrane protein involved in colicin uptake